MAFRDPPIFSALPRPSGVAKWRWEEAIGDAESLAPLDFRGRVIDLQMSEEQRANGQVTLIRLETGEPHVCFPVDAAEILARGGYRLKDRNDSAGVRARRIQAKVEKQGFVMRVLKEKQAIDLRNRSWRKLVMPRVYRGCSAVMINGHLPVAKQMTAYLLGSLVLLDDGRVVESTGRCWPWPCGSVKVTHWRELPDGGFDWGRFLWRVSSRFLRWLPSLVRYQSGRATVTDFDAIRIYGGMVRTDRFADWVAAELVMARYRAGLLRESLAGRVRRFAARLRWPGRLS